MPRSLSVKGMAVKPSSTLAITAKAKALKAEGKDVVGFGAGEPDFATPENICAAARKAIDDGFTKYTPAAGTVDLRKAVSDKFKNVNGLRYEPNQVVISNGGKHSLTNIFEAILNPGDEVIIPAPFWLSYPEIVKLSDGVPVIVRCDASQNYKITPEQLRNACTPKTKAFVLTSPSNPTGMVYSREELEALAQVICEQDIYVVSDEIYEYLTYDGVQHVSIGSLNDDILSHTITCNGMAKGYAMTGWRIGYCGAPADVAKVISSVQSHQTSNPNSIAQMAALEALTGPQESVSVMNAEFNRRRVYMYERISKMPHVQCLLPQGAFYVFVDVSEALGLSYKGNKIGDISEFARILIEDYLTAVIPCADFGFADHMRLSYAISMEQIEKGLDRIEEFLKGLE